MDKTAPNSIFLYTLDLDEGTKIDVHDDVTVDGVQCVAIDYDHLQHWKAEGRWPEEAPHVHTAMQARDEAFVRGNASPMGSEDIQRLFSAEKTHWYPVGDQQIEDAVGAYTHERLKVNLLLDFNDAAHEKPHLTVGVDKRNVDVERFDGASSVFHVADDKVHANFIDESALFPKQRARLLERKDTVSLPSKLSESKAFKNKTPSLADVSLGIQSDKKGDIQYADRVHVLGDISDLEVHVDGAILDTSDDIEYPVAMERGQTEFVFWGDDEALQPAYDAMREREKIQGGVTKVVELNPPALHSVVMMNGLMNCQSSVIYENPDTRRGYSHEAAEHIQAHRFPDQDFYDPA